MKLFYPDGSVSSQKTKPSSTEDEGSLTGLMSMKTMRIVCDALRQISTLLITYGRLWTALCTNIIKTPKEGFSVGVTGLLPSCGPPETFRFKVKEH